MIYQKLAYVLQYFNHEFYHKQFARKLLFPANFNQSIKRVTWKNEIKK